MTKTTAPYGAWRSPITSDLIVSSTISFGQVRVDGGDVYWIEGRPTEGGRNVIVRRTAAGQIADVTPPGFNARTRAHEYGGGDFAIADGAVIFSNFPDQRLYRQIPGEEPLPITPAGQFRYADGVFDRARNRLICVREDHSDPGEPANTIVAVDLAGTGNVLTLAGGHEFYAAPRLSPDGSRLAWLMWCHPNMPWDGCELWLGDLGAHGGIISARLIGGGPDEAIFQPTWSPDGALYFISDRTGWWNIYRFREMGGAPGSVEAVCPKAADFGQPQWVFGMSTFAFQSSRRLLCAYSESGMWRLASLELSDARLDKIDTPYTEIGQVQAAEECAVFVCGSPAEVNCLVRLQFATGQRQVLRRSSEVAIDPGFISTPQPIEFPSIDGANAYAFFYPPQNRDFAAPAGELPPLLVKSHGGPTAATSTALNLGTQYWTSRGIGVLDVNYGGSTGYGRAYRQRLDGRWGIVDVDDCVNAARYLVQRGLADGNRLAISGGSAGGYTTLAALTFRDTFKAGCSRYGIGDLEALARDTHKFESRYLDRLVAPYPARRDVYLARSPINFTDRLSCPVIVFQGLDDKVVPPNQAEQIVGALRAKGLPVAYVAFPGEGHGFRRAENIKRAIDGELYFYSRVFGFPLAEPVEPVPIENLQK